VAAQDPIADMMERAAPNRRDIRRQQVLDAPQHLFGGFVGERQEQDPPRRHTVLDQPRHAIRQRARLAAARARNDQHRPGVHRAIGACGRDRRELLVVEFRAVVDMKLPRPVRGLQNVLLEPSRQYSADYRFKRPREHHGRHKAEDRQHPRWHEPPLLGVANGEQHHQQKRDDLAAMRLFCEPRHTPMPLTSSTNPKPTPEISDALLPTRRIPRCHPKS
jgi:hypothetical protein